MNIRVFQFAIIMLMSVANAWADDVAGLINKNSEIWIIGEQHSIYFKNNGEYQYSIFPNGGGTSGIISTGKWSTESNRIILLGDWQPMNSLSIRIKKRFVVNITNLSAIEGKKNQYNAWVYFDEISIIK